MTDFLKNNIMYLIALLVTSVWAFLTFVITWAFITKADLADVTNLFALYSTVNGAFIGVLGYWFSTTKSSKEKDETIKDLINGKVA